MEQASPPTRSGPAPSLMVTWPIGVQVALALLITGTLFFFLGRWTYSAPAVNPPPVNPAERPAGLDLNRATKAELRLIPGIGESLAQRIVDHRERNGDFRSIDELRKVAGIGPKTLERIRNHLYVAAPESLVATDDDETMDSRPVQISRGTTVSKKAAELTAPIDVNRATQTELQKLPGIGPKLSLRIMDERARASFKSVEDLRRVPGIGPKTVEKLRPHVTVGS